MGGNASCSQAVQEEVGMQFDEIPEACVALVLSYLEPAEICKLARVSRAFRAAAAADFIWDSKLPSNYTYMLRTLLGVTLAASMSKRDIFSMLYCKSMPFDGGTKDVWMDKNNKAQICLAISAKGMRITGIHDRRYWIHIPTQESRFETIAYLQQIWWVEVEGEVDFQFPAGVYSLFFRLHLGRIRNSRLGRRRRRVCSTEDVHGWDSKPVQLQFTLPQDGQHATSKRFLRHVGTWVHYHVGDFVVRHQPLITKIKFSLTQIDCTHTKGGLSLDSVIICPTIN